MLQLPTDFLRSPLASFSRSHLAFQFPPDLIQRLERFSQQEGHPPSITLLAGFLLLLHQLCGQEELVLGAASTTCTHPAFETVLYMVLRPTQSVRQLLQEVCSLTLQPPSPQSEEGCKVMFALRELSPDQPAPGPLQVEELAMQTETAHVDLSLALWQGADQRLQGVCEYKSDLFVPETIARWLKHYEQVLLSLTHASLSEPLANLKLLPPEQEQLLLRQWNQTQSPYPAQASIAQLFEEQAHQRPEAIAVSWQGEQLSYGELERQSEHLAQRLRRWGVQPEVSVGLYLERSLLLPIALLGVLKAGGVYVPLDPGYPAERLAYMYRHPDVQVLLTQSSLLDRLTTNLPEAAGRPVLLLDSLYADMTVDTTIISHIQVQASNLAYVLYTSGTTGLPKGVAIPHTASVNHNLAIVSTYQLQPTDRILQFSSISFDVAIEEFISSWFGGATVILPVDQIPASYSEFQRLVETNAITILTLPTVFWHGWMQELAEYGGMLPQSLRLLLVGGENVIPDRLAIWQKLGGESRRWMNVYGTTETTAMSTIYSVSGPSDWNSWYFRQSVGRPIANTQVYVLDGWLSLAPLGVAGELYIGGAGLARGYLNQPGVTAERFVPNPFSQEPGARLYRTGDLVRWRPDGELEFLGRQDSQVKLRGYRIELGEVEAVLRQHPGVQEGVVLMRQDGGSSDKRLVAYVVPTDSYMSLLKGEEEGRKKEVIKSELRQYLQQRLPAYMVPSAFLWLDLLPLNSNGKLDRSAFPAPDSYHSTLDSNYIAPRTQEEQKLAEIWGHTLGVDRVGIHDNFFELGGDSILSIQIATRAQQFGLAITPRLIFEYPTVASLLMSVTKPDASGANAAPLERTLTEHVTDPVNLAGLDQHELKYLDALFDNL